MLGLDTMMSDILVRLFGWKMGVLFGDPALFDRWQFLRDRINHGSGRTLDAGCGSGAYALYAARLGNATVGISFDEGSNQKGANRARILGINNISFITADLRELGKYRDQLGAFDQIICFETIEHILNDEQLIKDLQTLLKAKGKIFLTTPFKRSNAPHGETLSSCEDGGHVREGYTHQEIKEIFARNGLTVIEETFITGFISQQLIYLTCWLDKHLPHSLTWGLVLPLRIFQAFDRLVTDLTGYPYLCIGVVGIKD
ncbi:MAG: class I SAM-dependent methyltransferase [Deltaproteobacteria bacterium]|nr:class I SAM-dependent methyltransferase [Deltaproteobacteria bacterium]